MKCSNCGYEFQKTELVKVKVSVDCEVHTTLDTVMQPGVVCWIPHKLWKITVECPKCKVWTALKNE